MRAVTEIYHHHVLHSPATFELVPPTCDEMIARYRKIVQGGFVYLVAGMRQGWAVWLLIAFCAVRLILYVPTFFHIESVSVRLLTAVYFILQAAAFWFVFTPAAKRWLAGAKRA